MAEIANLSLSSGGSGGKKSCHGSVTDQRTATSASAVGSGETESSALSLRGGGSAETVQAPPFGPRESNRKNFNQAKAHADAAAEAAQGASSSRRQSLSSQFSTTSTKASNRPGRGRKSKKKGLNDPQVQEIHVLDENGKDVTPKPLASYKPSVLCDKPAPNAAEGTEQEHSVPLYSRTGFSVTSTAGELTPEPLTVERSAVDTDLDGQESGVGGELDRKIPFKTPRLYPKRKYCIVPAPVVQVTDPKLLEMPLAITITKSEHFIMLSTHGRYINDTYVNYKEVLERNEKYAQLKEEKLRNPDNYKENTSQTLFTLLKNKQVQASALSTRSNSVQVNSWDIADSYSAILPWKAVLAQHEAKESGKPTESLTPQQVLTPEPFTETDESAPPIFSPPGSRRQSAIMASRRGSAVGGSSRRQSRVGAGGSQSRRTSVASRRPSTAGRAIQELGSDGMVPDAAAPGGDGGEPPKPPEVDLNTIPGLFKALEHVERACVLNTYHDRLLDYRNIRPREKEPQPPEPPPEQGKEGKRKKKKKKDDELDDAAAIDATLAPITETLRGGVPKVILPPLEESAAKVHAIWNYHSDVTDGRNISCMSVNKLNRNLIAVGYGEFEFGMQKDGMIAFWSSKNPRYPNAVITTSTGVTSLDFSCSRPSLLAVGLYNGNVAIYDVSNPRDLDPMAQTTFATGRHADPVWKVEWIGHAADRGEDLFSISTDGRVTQWAVKEDLEYKDLMKLKRVLSQGQGAQPQPFISRRSGGLCFDVSRRDRNIYLVGSEEGPIYKCDRSNSEKYLMSYTGHNGPVYQVRWSPFLQSLFLSCSADWTIRLWDENQEAALLMFETTTTPVADVRWSFTHACVFAMASADGHMEIWDLHLSVMKPIVAHTLAPDDESLLSCMIFSEEAPLIFLGGSTGAIYVIKYEGLLRAETDEGELKKLEDTLADVTHHGAT